MANTRPDILLKANVQTDLYAKLNLQTGFPTVAVGVKISLQNKGSVAVELSAKSTEPLPSDGSSSVSPGSTKTNDAGDSGAWAFSPILDSIINVGVA